MRALFVVWGIIVGAAALGTGIFPRPGFPFLLTGMTGILPPHYGYSTYTVVPLLFFGAPWVRTFAAIILLLSGNRAAWVGSIVGWIAGGGRRRLLLGAFLCVAGVIGGNALKPLGAHGDSVRVQLWKTAIDHAVKHPWGAEFCYGVAGRVTQYAHSDLLQLLVLRGWVVTAIVVLILLVGFYFLAPGPEKSVVAALMAQSLIDNRLHHPACAILFAAAWCAAVRASVRGPR